MYFLIVSGMSGAGKSRAVATLEDLGYYCVDNLPISLIPRFAEICLAATERYERVALVTDVRAGGDFQQLFDSLDSIKSMGCDYRILFLNTDTPTLIRRYKETRRKHPLMEKGMSMTAAIEKEREMLSGLRDRADFVVDKIKKSGAQGLVLIMQQFCDPEEMEYPYLKKALDAAGIPHIKLGVDQQMRDFGQASTAIQAFADVL